MSEVFAILVAVGALIVGILGIGWAYGDFRPRSGASTPQTGPQPKSS